MINNTNNANDNQLKVGNYNEYIHNPDPEHQVTRIVTTQEAIDNIREHFNPYDYNYIQNFNDALNDSNNVSEYIDYVSTERYMKSHEKTREDYRFEDTYFNKQLEQMADIMLREYDNQNGEYAGYTLMSDYSVERDKRKNVGIDTDAESEAIKRGLTIHVDLLDSVNVDQKLELSERVKRKQRYEDIEANLHKYPDLKQMYDEWEQMGYNYGFHSAYTAEEKQIIREYWLQKFRDDYDNPHTPESRLYQIREQYNEFGYDMHLALEALRVPTESKNKMYAINNVAEPVNEALELLESVLDLTDVKHVKALLDIQKESRKARLTDKVEHVSNWYFIWGDLEDRFQPDVKYGGINTVLYHFAQAVKLADVDEYQREILNVIRCSNKWLNGLESDCVELLLDNPYKLILKLLEEKFGMKLNMRQLKAENNKLAKVLADAYDDVINDRSAKECVTCAKSKMPSAYYDGRNECKKCYIESQQVV